MLDYEAEILKNRIEVFFIIEDIFKTLIQREILWLEDEIVEMLVDMLFKALNNCIVSIRVIQLMNSLYVF